MTNFLIQSKLTDLETKIPDISNLATKIALTTVESYQMLVVLLKKTITKKTITQKLLRLKVNLMIIIMANILILQSLIN